MEWWIIAAMVAVVLFLLIGGFLFKVAKVVLVIAAILLIIAGAYYVLQNADAIPEAGKEGLEALDAITAPHLKDNVTEENQTLEEIEGDAAAEEANV